MSKHGTRNPENVAVQRRNARSLRRGGTRHPKMERCKPKCRSVVAGRDDRVQARDVQPENAALQVPDGVSTPATARTEA
jgi:hypothetical protein